MNPKHSGPVLYVTDQSLQTSPKPYMKCNVTSKSKSIPLMKECRNHGLHLKDAFIAQGRYKLLFLRPRKIYCHLSCFPDSIYHMIYYRLYLFLWPYFLISRINDILYRIQESPRCKARLVHYDCLKLYKWEKELTRLKFLLS